MKKGKFCLSFDIEGMWGRKQVIPGIGQENEMVGSLVSLLVSHRIRGTWAVVGKLFEEDKTLIRMLQTSGHEIAGHSYSHLDFSQISRDEAEQQINKSVTIAKKHGVKLKSFIFPFNHVRHIDLLKKYGFKAFRGPSSNPWRFITPQGDKVTTISGLRQVPGSMYFPSTRKWGKLLPHGIRLFQAKRGLDEAVRTGQVFHLWSHPIDFIDESGALFGEFKEIIQYADTLKAQGKIEIKTMNQCTQEHENG